MGFIALLIAVLIILKIFGISYQTIFRFLGHPGQTLEIFFNEKVKRNHTLEHATMNVIEEDAGKMLNLSGMSNQEGFLIKGIDETNTVSKAVRKAFDRLKDGEEYLAVYRNCEVTKLAVSIVCALIFLLLAAIRFRVFFIAPRFFLLALMVSLLLGSVVGYILNGWAQRRFATSLKVDDLMIDSVESKSGNRILNRAFSKSVFVYIKHLKRVN